jgi:serine protease
MFGRILLAVSIASLSAPWQSNVWAYNSFHPAVKVYDTWVLSPDLGQVSAQPRHCSDDIIVKFIDECPAEDRDKIAARYGCAIAQSCEGDRFHRVRIPPEETPERMVSLLETEDAVEYAELNYYASVCLVPDDPYFFPYQWALQNDATGGINMEAAWDIETGDPNVIVAILDTGIAYEDYGDFRQAPDLAQTRFVPGYDFVNDDAHPNDDRGHGTHMAGTIAQSTNNDRGVAGIAFGCSIMPVKVLADDGIGDYFDIARGIYYAAENGAHVLNMSFGGPDRSRTIEQAVAFAYGSGATIICAAGNDFEDGNPPSYPAAYNDYCIAVGAVRYDDARAYYSNTGAYLDVVAPGGDLLVDQNGDGYPDGIIQQTFTTDPRKFNYYFFQGTSSAAAHVSGVAALLVSRGVADPDAVRAAIEGTARDVGPTGWDAQYGWGVVDAHAALLYGVP